MARPTCSQAFAGFNGRLPDRRPSGKQSLRSANVHHLTRYRPSIVRWIVSLRVHAAARTLRLRCETIRNRSYKGKSVTRRRPLRVRSRVGVVAKTFPHRSRAEHLSLVVASKNLPATLLLALSSSLLFNLSFKLLDMFTVSRDTFRGFFSPCYSLHTPTVLSDKSVPHCAPYNLFLF